MREDEVCAPCKIFVHDVLAGYRKLFSIRLHGSHIGIFYNGTLSSIGDARANQVVVVTTIPIESNVDTIVEEAQV